MKQRVLIVNKFYYRRGGDCVCAINLEQLLKANGHEVAVFAMQYPENLGSSWSAYWPEEVNFSGSLTNKLQALKRTMGFGDVKRQFARMLRDFRPDVVHLHNIHSYISPVVARMARKASARVIWTLHDYKLLCPSYSCLRQGHTCELCFTSKRAVLTNRCMKQSLAASAVAYMEALRWSRHALSAITDAFICPSHFMARKMEQGGFLPRQLHTLCNFIPPAASESFHRLLVSGQSAPRKPYYCYIGRLSSEKGVATLLEAAAALPFELRVAGDGPLGPALRDKFGHCANIRFLGHLDAAAIQDLLANARFSVMPSECYENNPLGVIESLCAGTPVIGAEIGGIPELITPGCGLTYESGNRDRLKETIHQAWTTAFDHQHIASEALKRFSASAYYNRLLGIYAR